MAGIKPQADPGTTKNSSLSIKRKIMNFIAPTAPAANSNDGVDEASYRLSRVNLKSNRTELPNVGGQWNSSAMHPTSDGPATFDPSTLARFQTSWLSGMQLSLWDNIFGPQVIKVLCFMLRLCFYI